MFFSAYFTPFQNIGEKSIPPKRATGFPRIHFCGLIQRTEKPAGCHHILNVQNFHGITMVLHVIEETKD